jgi:glutaconyl-CoA/methylmalonyl-CoA decarboxylase subunit delta
MENLGFGLEITLLGMGIVFALLALLWGVLALLLRFDRSPESSATTHMATDEAYESSPAVQDMTHGLDRDTLAAITIAVLAHRAIRRKQAAPAMRYYRPGSLLYASRWLVAGRARQNRSWGRR